MAPTPGPSTPATETDVRDRTGSRPGGRSDGCLVVDGDALTAVEWWVPTGRVVLAGAPGLAEAVEAQARLLGWSVSVLAPDAATEAARVATPADAVVVLSHEPTIDEPVLVAALQGHAGYIGAIGSRGTVAARPARLIAAGADPATFHRIHSPVGLDLGGTNPAETALSICAEILAGRAGRSAAPLASTTGAITG